MISSLRLSAPLALRIESEMPPLIGLWVNIKNIFPENFPHPSNLNNLVSTVKVSDLFQQDLFQDLLFIKL